MGFPGGSNGKESACNEEDLGSIPGLGRSTGKGNGYSLQYSCLENSMDRTAWQITVHGVTELDTTEQPSFPLSYIYIEREYKIKREKRVQWMNQTNTTLITWPASTSRVKSKFIEWTFDLMRREWHFKSAAILLKVLKESHHKKNIGQIPVEGLSRKT